MRLMLISVSVTAALVSGCHSMNVVEGHSAPQLISTRNSIEGVIQQKVDKAVNATSINKGAPLPSSPVAWNEKGITPSAFVPTTKSHPVQATPEQTVLIVRAGETWERALSRWFRESGYKSVMVYFPSGEPAGFSESPKEKKFSSFDFNGAMDAARTAFINETKTQYVISYDTLNKSAVIHSPGVSVQTFQVTAGSLKANISRLVAAYGWNTTEKDWKTKDFYVSAGWPIVTELGDVVAAMNELVESFPVQPQLLKATQTVYFVKRP